LRDVWENEVRLTQERLAHLSEHPEMKDQEDKVDETLLQPDVITQSRSGETVRLFHRCYSDTLLDFASASSTNSGKR